MDDGEADQDASQEANIAASLLHTSGTSARITHDQEELVSCDLTGLLAVTPSSQPELCDAALVLDPLDPLNDLTITLVSDQGTYYVNAQPYVLTASNSREALYAHNPNEC